MPGEFSYPKRPRFFALKFCRLLWKACAANELGPDVCWMLAGIAMTEDARGYRSPVTYFNEQLFAVCGYGSVDAMARARQKAVVSGWLQYLPGGNRTAGKYFVTIPDEHRDWDDMPTDEGDINESIYRKNAESSATEPRLNRERSAEPTATEPRLKCGTFLPVPIPTPVPNTEAPAAAVADSPKPKSKSPPKDPPESVPIPAEIDTPEFRAVWSDWIAERKDRKKPLTARAAKSQLQVLATLGPEKASECVSASIRNGWAGLFPESGDVKAKPKMLSFKQSERAEADALQDAMTVKTATFDSLPEFIEPAELEAHCES